MSGNLYFKRITTLLKLFTHIVATVIILINNNPDDLTFLIPLIIIQIFISYYREFYLIANNKDSKYIWASLIMETLAIMVIGFADKTGVSLLYFLTCMSETVISFPFSYSIFLIFSFLASRVIVDILRNPSKNIFAQIGEVLLTYGVSTVFVAGMSYLVKKQVHEKEKQIRINRELEEAYKKVVDSASITQQLSIEKERTRMAREIHDTLAHTLTTLIVQLEACKKLASVDASRLPVELEKAQELTRSGLNDVKRTIKALRPQALEGKSFFDSLSGLVNDIMQSASVKITVNNLLPKELKLQASVEVALYRVIQESMTNSIRHGKATAINIDMNLINEKVVINIEDNGMGCIHIKKGYGLHGIGERIEGLDGKVNFWSTAGKGFKTTISIPSRGIVI